MPEKKDTCGDCMKWKRCWKGWLEASTAPACTGFTPKAKAEPAKENPGPIKFIITGWECPRCGRMNSPWTTQCPCPPELKSPHNPDYNPWYPKPPWCRPYSPPNPQATC